MLSEYVFSDEEGEIEMWRVLFVEDGDRDTPVYRKIYVGEES